MSRSRKRLFPLLVALLLPIPLLLFRFFSLWTFLAQDFSNVEHLSSFSPPPILIADDRLVTPSSTTRDQQAQNFVDGKAIMLSIHITHHAGTTLCSRFGRAVGAPGKFCNHPSMDDGVAEDYPDYNPWLTNETSANIERSHRAFRFVAWEYRNPPRPSLSGTNWEDPLLVSVLIIRDPIARLLAGDGFVSSTFPGVSRYAKEPASFTGNPSHHEWFRFSRHSRNDNPAIRILAGHDCCSSQKEVTDEHLQKAKELISRFTFVLDQACLDDNLKALGSLLNVTLLHRPGGTEGAVGGRRHPTNRDRIPFDDIYDYLLQRNKNDVELYQWSKRRSLVQCLDEGLS